VSPGPARGFRRVECPGCIRFKRLFRAVGGSIWGDRPGAAVPSVDRAAQFDVPRHRLGRLLGPAGGPQRHEGPFRRRQGEVALRRRSTRRVSAGPPADRPGSAASVGEGGHSDRLWPIPTPTRRTTSSASATSTQARRHRPQPADSAQSSQGAPLAARRAGSAPPPPPDAPGQRTAAARRAGSAHRRRQTRRVSAPPATRRAGSAPSRESRDEPACRPGSVSAHLAVSRSATIHLGLPLPTASCGLPVSSGGPPSNAHARSGCPSS
jgi:hypothetical protein